MIKKQYHHKSSTNTEPTHEATFFDYEYCKKEWLHEFSVEFKEIGSNIGTMYKREEFEEMIREFKEIII